MIWFWHDEEGTFGVPSSFFRYTQAMTCSAERCPACNVSLVGEPIPETAQGYYGTHTHFSRIIAIEKNDRVDHWRCPDCGYQAKSLTAFRAER